MKVKMLIAVLSTILPVLSTLSAQSQEETQDIWKPFQFFVGQWEGKEGFVNLYICIGPAMVRKGGRPPAHEARRESALVSPAFAVQLSLDSSSPFVPDGRHSLAELSFKVDFSSVTFEFDPDEDPLLGRCQVNAVQGKGAFSRLLLNEAQVGEERVASSFLSQRPREFGAGLAIEAEPTAEDEAAAQSKLPPEKVQLSFWTDLGPVPVTWGSKFGSAGLPDFKIIFEVPFRRLIEGKPFSVTLPYQGRYAEDKGIWRIDIRLKPKASGRS